MSASLRRTTCLAIIVAFFVTFPVARAADSPAKVYVILWFDTEDYLLPADDDATKHIAEFLTSEGIRGTFKLVGEKARTLERRKRTDVIAALQKHEIGYHSNFHSIPPSPAQYLDRLGWDNGIAEFDRRERGGVDDVKRIFGTMPTCYGQPGSSWAPQTYAALPGIGILPCYVDDGDHVGVGGRPFRYCGAIVVYKMQDNVTRMDLYGDGGLEKGCKAFEEIHSRLKREGGGLISIYYHPCEWVHRQFWDGVNFSRGANPPRSEWKEPPQRPREETEAAFARFEKYVDFQKSLGVALVTASELPQIYEDPVRKGPLPLEDLRRAAGETARAGKLDWLDIGGGRFLSPADLMAALVETLAGTIEAGVTPKSVPVPEVLGPAEVPPATGPEEATWSDFRSAVLDTLHALRARRQVPSRVFLGARAVAPADFLLACARIVADETFGPKTLPVMVKIHDTVVATADRVAQDSPGIFGGWVIHPEGFRAPRILEMGRLQAWTLKPAAAVR